MRPGPGSLKGANGCSREEAGGGLLADQFQCQMSPDEEKNVKVPLVSSFAFGSGPADMALLRHALSSMVCFVRNAAVHCARCGMLHGIARSGQERCGIGQKLKKKRR